MNESETIWNFMERTGYKLPIKFAKIPSEKKMKKTSSKVFKEFMHELLPSGKERQKWKFEDEIEAFCPRCNTALGIHALTRYIDNDGSLIYSCKRHLENQGLLIISKRIRDYLSAFRP